MRFTIPSLLITLVAILLLAAVGAAEVNQAPRPGGDGASYVKTRRPVALSEQARDFLKERDGDTATVWVFFTDKGFTDKRGFTAAAASVRLTERAMRRRARVGLDKVVFVDLPVYGAYVQQVVRLGAVHRRSSRWLNAASFRIPASRLDDVAQLPFVASLTPVARFRGPDYSTSDSRPESPQGALSPEALDYGLALGQMTQINAVTANQEGYNGTGVTLTILDTGFRKSHAAFQSHFAAGRVLAEYDFLQDDSETANQDGDAYNQWNHGTLIWAVSGGYAPGHVIGPAYGANFILCKTENAASETQVEEDNWVAGMEFADSIGTDVITSSLAYSDWYTYSDFDGATAVTTLAANRCDSLGIVLCNAMANEGPSSGSLKAPADAFNILAVGAVDHDGVIAGFSSRGPTYDGRVKPEVCAQGVSTYAATASSDLSYGYANGTSLSTPLVAGAACLVIQAHPDRPPALIREALKATADRASAPNNTYGWGIINVDQAIQWPMRFYSTVTYGQPPLTVNFYNQSWLDATEVQWDFGDGQTSTLDDPVHEYTQPGSYDVTLTIQTAFGEFSRTVPSMVLVHADSLRVDSLWAETGVSNRVDIRGRNFIPLDGIELPFTWDGSLQVRYDSFSTAGLRTAGMGRQLMESYDPYNKRATIYIAPSATQASLPPGEGSVVSLYFTVTDPTPSGLTPIKIQSYASYTPHFVSGSLTYEPATIAGALSRLCCNGLVGDVDGVDGDEPTLADVLRLADFMFGSLEPLDCYAEADINQSGGPEPTGEDITIGDLSRLIDYLYIYHNPLPTCLSE